MSGARYRYVKQTPTDVWSVRERLALACSVLKSGDQNWVSVSRSVKPFGDSSRHAEWFSQKNCALQYSDLLEKVETPKRKRSERGEPHREIRETPEDMIVRKLTIERIEDLKRLVQEEQQKYNQLKMEVEMIQAGQMDEKVKDMWEQIEIEIKVEPVLDEKPVATTSSPDIKPHAKQVAASKQLKLKIGSELIAQTMVPAQAFESNNTTPSPTSSTPVTGDTQPPLLSSLLASKQALEALQTHKSPIKLLEYGLDIPQVAQEETISHTQIKQEPIDVETVSPQPVYIKQEDIEIDDMPIVSMTTEVKTEPMTPINKHDADRGGEDRDEDIDVVDKEDGDTKDVPITPDIEEPLSPASSIMSNESKGEPTHTYSYRGRGRRSRGGRSRGRGRVRLTRSKIVDEAEKKDDDASSKPSDGETTDEDTHAESDSTLPSQPTSRLNLSTTESFPNSPASFAPSDTEAEREHKMWKKSIMLVWRAAANHKYANVFLHPVTEDIAPGYHNVVFRPMDLTTIKKNLETMVIRTTSDFQRDMMLMFTNAIMYNNSDHDVYNMALEMYNDVMIHIEQYVNAQMMVQSEQRAKALRGSSRTRSEAMSDKEEDVKKRRLSNEPDGAKIKKKQR